MDFSGSEAIVDFIPTGSITCAVDKCLKREQEMADLVPM